MSERENFMARWSRRKREAAEEVDATKSAGASAPAAASANASEGNRSDAASAGSATPQPSEAAFDLTKLPPVEAITADSDIRAFLAPGVSPELTRAALRRAWATDPKIRDFVGLSENAWDFNAPGAIAGFGPLEMTDELRRQVARMVGRGLAGDAAERPPELPGQPSPPAATTPSANAAAELPIQQAQSTPAPPPNEGIGKDNEQHGAAAVPQRNKAAIAPQPDPENSDNDQLIAKRIHGRALPK